MKIESSLRSVNCLQQLFKKHLFIILILVAIVFALGLTNIKKINNEVEEIPTELLHEEAEEVVGIVVEPAENTQWMVDIKGEVKNPGVYTMEKDARVLDVIVTANGLTEQADEDQVNLAERIYDEMVIYIPKIGESDTEYPVTQRSLNEQSTGVRINQATKEEIETLNGIGPSKAEAIIVYREENGPFQSAEDLLNISGIGEKTLENLKDDIIIP